ncbi:MAG TPA: hypothetical protein VNZ52_10870 [Candidatus Thermoplasmatota archaeon]|nr:hypothetical protein [Candidatus Thermoplasmatota archaeon]
MRPWELAVLTAAFVLAVNASLFGFLAHERGVACADVVVEVSGAETGPEAPRRVAETCMAFFGLRDVAAWVGLGAIGLALLVPIARWLRAGPPGWTR